MVNIEKFVKVLEKTTSSWDNEALVAIRLANKMLKDENMTWHMFFDKMSKSSSGVSLDDIFRDIEREARRWEASRQSAPHRPVRKPKPNNGHGSAEPFKKKVFKIRRNK